jgi:hypothetical protein
MPDARVENNLARLYTAQQSVARALEDDPRHIRRIKNVVDLGVGFQWKQGKPTKRIGPVVLVLKKVPISKLVPTDRVPKSLRIGNKIYRIDVLERGRLIPTCSTGITDDQHKTRTSVPPGVAMCAVVNGAIPPGRQGSTGAILKVVDTPQPPARYVLTCDHIVTNAQDWAQTWVTHPIMGSWVASTTPPIDASMVETQFYLLAILCLNVDQKAPIPPLVGMRVMKSGAATGVTGSQVALATPADDVYIDNDASVPRSTPALPYLFNTHGDSGSVAWLGTPPDPRDVNVNPFDLGQPIDNAITPVVNLEPAAQRPAKRKSLLEDYRGRAVSLLSGAGGGQQPGVGGQLPNRWSFGPSVQKVLADFTRQRGKPVIIADD